MPNTLLDIIELIYATALGSETNDALLEALCDYFRCETVYFAEPAYGNGARLTEQSGSLSSLPRKPATGQPRGATSNTRDHAENNYISSIYDPSADHPQRHAVEITDRAASINMAGKHSLPFSLCLRRAPSAKGFDKKDNELLLRLAPHLEQARRISKNLADRSSAALHLIKELIEFLPFSVVILDSNGQLYLTNEIAASAPGTDGLALNADGLEAAVEDENRALQRLIKDSCDLREHATGNTPFRDITISKRSGKRPYIVTSAVIPAGYADDNGGGPAIILFIHDSERDWVVPYKRFKSLFGLTQTEARVATAVMQGKTLQQCADNLGHSLSTSRNMLKRVFAKTDTCRQNQLASLLAHTTVNILRGESRR